LELLLTLPSEKMFALIDPVVVNPIITDVKIGEEQVTEYRESGSCFKTVNPVSFTHDIMQEVSLRQVILPDFDTMADQWASGVSNAKSTLWDSLRGWIIKYMDSTNIVLNESINEMLNLIERGLQEQLIRLEKDLNLEIETLANLESRNKSAQKIACQLESIAIKNA